MKTRAKRAEERQKFYEKLNKRPKKVKNNVGNTEKPSFGGNQLMTMKIKISRDQMGLLSIKNSSIDDELPALIKQEPIDDEYEVGQNASDKQPCSDDLVKKNSVATQCFSNQNELWLYVGRKEKNTVDVQTQTSPCHDEIGECNAYCQYLLFGQYCGPNCQFLRLMI